MEAWNKATIAAVTSRGSVAGPIAIYSASKTLAEHAARKFVAGHKVKLAWDLVVCNRRGSSTSPISPAR